MRTLTWSLHAAALAALSLAATGCTLDIHEHRDRGYDEHRVVVERRYEYRPERVVVVDAPPPDQVTVVTEAPPPPYAEVIPAPPGPDYVWIGGYWVVSGNRWVWIHGHHERPPHRGAVWVGHSWDHHGDRFELHVGHWR